jgi:hypothetical protein
MGGACGVTSLGPITEERFRDVFTKGAQATAKDAAWLLGIDSDTLNEMTNDGAIRAVRRGSIRSWTEADLRAFLLEGPDAPERKRQPTKPATAPRGGKVVPFSQRKGARARQA